MEDDLILYHFSRSNIDRGDFSNFRSLYAAGQTAHRSPIAGNDELLRVLHSVLGG